jgi:CDP-diacylglycerol--glycerol-3-phosphate 3-phosphatidyltransferase
MTIKSARAAIQETLSEIGGNMMTQLPNILTVMRLAMVPAFIYVYLSRPYDMGLALGVYVAAMLTDALDGFLARKMHCESRFGALADPLADKLMTISAISCLVYSGVVPLAALLLLGIKELLMMACACIAARAGVVIPAALPGKLATVLFTLALLLLLPWHGITALYIAGRYVLYGAIAISFFAAAYYGALAFRAGLRLRAR